MISNAQVEIPEPDNYDPKEVYAFFGLASYFAQVLERGLMIMVLAFRCRGLHIMRSEFDAFYTEYNRKTLGQLLNRARKSISISDDIDALLDEALLKRNWLMHRYFADRSAQFNTEIGRIEMISELQTLIRIFIEADHATELIYMPILKELGVTEKRVETLIEEMIEEYLIGGFLLTTDLRSYNVSRLYFWLFTSYLPLLLSINSFISCFRSIASAK